MNKESMNARPALASLFACLLAACGSGGADSADVAGADVSATAPLSFRLDVMPILSKSCAFGSCHGAASAASNHGVFLGADPAAVRAALVNVPSSQAPSLAYVTPRDPSASYLMHKLDGELAEGGGASMPKGADLLPSAKRDVVRRWIAAGARDD